MAPFPHPCSSVSPTATPRLAEIHIYIQKSFNADLPNLDDLLVPTNHVRRGSCRTSLSVQGSYLGFCCLAPWLHCADTVIPAHVSLLSRWVHLRHIRV